MGDYDKNLFLDCQFHNDSLCWILKSQSWAKEGDSVNEGDYTEEILRGVIQEVEFAVSGNNQFETGDTIGNVGRMITDLTKGLGDFTSKMAVTKSALNDALGGYGINHNTMNSLVEKGSDLVGQGIGKVFRDDMLGNQVADSIKKVTNHLYSGSQFISAFDYIKVFKGTDFDIEFPSLETRIYHRQWKGKTVNEVVDQLIKRFSGGTSLWSDSTCVVDKVVGVQKPPNGYIPKFTTLGSDEKITGTFGLTYGTHQIDNLLVVGFDYRLSTFKVREPKVKSNGVNLSTGLSSDVMTTDNPLYVDVRIQVRPATYISRDSIRKILNIVK